MGLLVEDLLTLARLDQQRPLNLAPVDLLALAGDAVQDARMVAPGRPIDLSVAPGAAFLVDGDEPRLRQVIGNLLNNALTHTPPDTPVRVKIASGMLDHGAPAVVLDVEDDGPGMERDQAQRVFERFYRADQARNRASGGTGLGLAIVSGLVAAHGGTVSVRTAPGEGADFQVRLPLSPDARVGARRRRRRGLAGERSVAAAPTTSRSWLTMRAMPVSSIVSTRANSAGLPPHGSGTSAPSRPATSPNSLILRMVSGAASPCRARARRFARLERSMARKRSRSASQDASNWRARCAAPS